MGEKIQYYQAVVCPEKLKCRLYLKKCRRPTARKVTDDLLNHIEWSGQAEADCTQIENPLGGEAIPLIRELKKPQLFHKKTPRL